MHALKGIAAKFDPRNENSSKEAARKLRTLDERDIYRYRKQRGVNLGSWFVLEKWISGAPYKNAVGPASSDYDVACGNNAKEILERHWDTWIVEDDWKWISERGLNSIRLPIGYYHLVGKDPAVVAGTPFAQVGSVFEGAWSRIVGAIDTASKYGIGVLIDLHSAPGKQNGDAHSGINGSVEFYNKSNLSRTVQILKLLASEFSGTPNVVGIQLVNEPQNNQSLPGWYNSALDSIREVAGPDLPLYIHDAWSTHQFASLIHDRSDFVVLDHHLYRCFTAQDQGLSGDKHASALPQKEFSQYAGTTRGNIVVAEFSAALNPKSYGHNTDAGEQDRQRRVFARAELDLFEEYCGGWWMWTYKKDGWDAGWSLRDTVRAEIMPNWVGRRRNSIHPHSAKERDEQCANALGQHAQYWSTQKGVFEHWRFEAGFKQGWDDVHLFASFSPPTPVPTALSELGFTGQWLKRRVTEHVAGRGKSKNVWEYEHGFGQGLHAARKVFLGL